MTKHNTDKMLEELDKSHMWRFKNFEKPHTKSFKKNRPKAVLLNMKNDNKQRYLEKIEIHKDEELLPVTSLVTPDLEDCESDSDILTDDTLLVSDNDSVAFILPDSAIDISTDRNSQQSSMRTVPNILRTNAPKIQSHIESSSMTYKVLVNNYNTSKLVNTLSGIELVSESMRSSDAVVVQTDNTERKKRGHKRKQVYSSNDIRQDTSDWNNNTVTPNENNAVIMNNTTMHSERKITFDWNDETEKTMFARKKTTRQRKILSVKNKSTVPAIQNDDSENTNNTLCIMNIESEVPVIENNDSQNTDNTHHIMNNEPEVPVIESNDSQNLNNIIATANNEPDDKSVSPLLNPEVSVSQVNIDTKFEEAIDCLSNDIFNKYCYECYSDNPVNYVGEFVAQSNELTSDYPTYGNNTYDKNCDMNSNNVSNETSQDEIFNFQNQKNTILPDQFVLNEPMWMKNIKFGNEINLGSIFQCDFCNDYSENCIFCLKDNNNCSIDAISPEKNKNLSDTISSRIDGLEDVMQIISDDDVFKDITTELMPESTTEETTDSDDFNMDEFLKVPKTNTELTDFDSCYIDDLVNCDANADFNDMTETMLLALLNEAFPNHHINNNNHYNKAGLLNDIFQEDKSKDDNNNTAMSNSSSLQETDSDNSSLTCFNEEEVNSRTMRRSRRKTVEKDREVYHCDSCPFSFTSRRALSLHRTGAHGGFYYFSCDHCGRLFNNQYTLRRHSIHCDYTTSVIIYNCAECDKTYRYKSSLIQHLQSVHNEKHPSYGRKRFACDKCSKTYVRLGAYKNHLKTHEIDS